jgi:phage protein D
MELNSTSKLQGSLHTVPQSSEALTPVLQVLINGETELVKDRVISIRTTDEAGIMSDSCEIELDDFDDAFPIPCTEAVISVSLGYKGGELTKIGNYYVKEIDIDGARKTLKIKANAASKAMRSQKSKSREGGLKDMIPEMAGEFGLDSAIDDGVAEDLKLEDFPQFAESDMNYMTRLSQKVGAVAKPSDSGRRENTSKSKMTTSQQNSSIWQFIPESRRQAGSSRGRYGQPERKLPKTESLGQSR